MNNGAAGRIDTPADITQNELIMTETFAVSCISMQRPVIEPSDKGTAGNTYAHA